MAYHSSRIDMMPLPVHRLTALADEFACDGPDWLDSLDRYAAEITLRRDSEIFAQGENAVFCYRVMEGCVRTVRLMEDGRRQITDFHLRDDLIGLDDMGQHASSAEAVSDVVLLRYPRAVVEQLAARNGTLSNHLREFALDSLRRAHERMLLLGRKTALERLSSFLVDLAHRLKPAEGGRLELPMSRLDIADHLGLTVETVCRNLAVLQRQGTVRVAGPAIHLTQWRALEQLAEVPHQPLPVGRGAALHRHAAPRGLAMPLALVS